MEAKGVVKMHHVGAMTCRCEEGCGFRVWGEWGCVLVLLTGRCEVSEVCGHGMGSCFECMRMVCVVFAMILSSFRA